MHLVDLSYPQRPIVKHPPFNGRNSTKTQLLGWKLEAIRLEAIATRVEAIAILLEAIASLGCMRLNSPFGVPFAISYSVRFCLDRSRPSILHRTG